MVRFLSILILFCSSAFGATQLLPSSMQSVRNQGMNALFNMNHAEARTIFKHMIGQEPQHPAGYIYMANTIWLNHLADLRRLQTSVYNRGTTFYGKTEDAVDPKVDKEFRTYIDKGILLCENRLKSNKNDIPTLYYLGIARNILAGYEATVKRSFLAALRNGAKGVGLHREIGEKDPSLVDAQLSVGMYNYVVGSLPLGVKVLAFIGGVRGSKKDGIAMLEKVAREGDQAKEEAKVLLIMLYNREKRVEDALRIVKDLSERYPQNSLFQLERAMTLGQLKKFQESSNEFERILRDPGAMDYIPDLIHYQYATMLFDAHQWQESLNHYVSAYQSPKAPPALNTLAHLNAGKCLDAMGKRNEALAEYQTVLKRKDMFDSHDSAKKYVKIPYAPGGRIKH